MNELLLRQRAVRSELSVSRPVDVIGPVWCKHILSAIYNVSLKTKFYLKTLAPIKFADAAALFICNPEVLGSNLG
jgi:hypothetical protein